jgi:DNA-3-methyladenine glycosylase
MFGKPRRWYVYRIYGLHWMLNVVTGPGTSPTAVLIRAAGPAAGPAAVCARLGIDGRWSGRPATRAAGLWIEDAPRTLRLTVEALPRVGIAYAGLYWARRRLRFRLGRARAPAR